MDVRDLGVALWRQKLLVLLILVIAGGAVAVGLWRAPKSYTATATVLTAKDPAATGSPAELNELRATLAELAGSRDVALAVQSRLREEQRIDRSVGSIQEAIDAEWVRDTILVRVTAENRNPEVAASIANLVADQLDEVAPADGTFVFAVTDPAEPPEMFSSPDLRLTIPFGAAAAVLLAAAGALLRDRRANTVDDAAAAEGAAVAPLLAHLPPPRDPTIMPALYPGTTAADRFRHLRMALEIEASGGGSNKVVVAGVTSGDFTVWLAANVAIALAGVGRRVLLVDGRMGERFGRPVEAEPDTPGLYDVLSGDSLEAALSPGPVELLSVLPSGRWGDQPVEALLKSRFEAVMDQAAGAFDVVLVLAPPLDVCDDARMMAAGGSLVLAVPQGEVSTSALRGHSDRIRAFGARLLGVVLIGRRAEPVVA